MKANIHPTWYPEATVTCACGNSWKTGATVAEIRTDICSQCHPFFTGEQRIVDTEGQVDRFMKRLEVRNNIRQQAEDRKASLLPQNLTLAEISEINKRYSNILIEHGITHVNDVIAKLRDEGNDSFLEIPGIGRKALTDIKRALRGRGYEVPGTVDAEAEATE
jgi:large subunit ribosomal protein L31